MGASALLGAVRTLGRRKGDALTERGYVLASTTTSFPAVAPPAIMRGSAMNIPAPIPSLGELLATGDLLGRAQSGDRQAIDLLLSRYQRPLQNLLHLRLTPNTRRLLETQDLVQEVLTRALARLPQ